MKIKYDYRKLLGKIKEEGLTLKEFAKLIGISQSTLSIKLSCKAYFTQKEMGNTCKVLGIDAKDIGIYFFTQKV